MRPYNRHTTNFVWNKMYTAPRGCIEPDCILCQVTRLRHTKDKIVTWRKKEGARIKHGGYR